MKGRDLSKESVAKQIEAVQLASNESTRLLDLTLVLRRKKTSEPLVYAGGVWDRLDRKFVSRESDTGQIFDVVESQVEFLTWFDEWLHAYATGKPRDVSVAMVGGARRGGKTVMGICAVLAAALEVPNTICWLVAKAFPETKELDRWVRDILPASFYVGRKHPQIEYYLANGSVISIESADDPERLKKGRADVVLINEPQKIDVGAFSHALGGTIDTGGLVICAANPPRKLVGQWVLRFKELIDEGNLAGCKFFQIDPTLNDTIDVGSRGRHREIVTALDPKLARADAEGAWFSIIDAAYPKFNPRENIKPVPEIGDMTNDVVRRKLGRDLEFIGGLDFQGAPYNCAVYLKAFRGLDGKPIFWALREFAKDGIEDDLIDVMEQYAPANQANTVLVGDASGTWQDAHHMRGRHSFDFFKRRRWLIVPPRKKKTEQGEHPKNPPIEDRVNLVNYLLSTRRLMIDPGGCPRLIAALKECEVYKDSGKPKGKYSHITDALGYALYWAEPAPMTRSGPPQIMTFPNARPKMDW